MKQAIEEIKEMIEKVDIEIEAFVHGAMCIAYSGRCTLCNHMTARDSNRGGCCQSCRWDYDLVETDHNIRCKRASSIPRRRCSICDESKRFKFILINSKND